MILVTGADGLVGRAVCRLLREGGQAVVPVVRARRDATPSDALEMDLSRTTGLHDAIRQDIDAVIHLAAAVPHSPLYPDTDATSGLTRAIDRNVAHLAHTRRCPVVYASTCGLYDRTSPGTKREDDPSVIRIQGPYFAAKYDGERVFAREACSVIVRISAPVGPGLQPGLVVSRFMNAARRDETLAIWGSGSREQDFVDVRDLARLLTAAALGPTPCTVNAAAGYPTTMTELAEAVVRVVGKGRVRYAGVPDPHEAETARYAIGQAKAVYGWEPQIPIAETLRWMLEETWTSERSAGVCPN